MQYPHRRLQRIVRLLTYSIELKSLIHSTFAFRDIKDMNEIISFKRIIAPRLEERRSAAIRLIYNSFCFNSKATSQITPT